MLLFLVLVGNPLCFDFYVVARSLTLVAALGMSYAYIHARATCKHMHVANIHLDTQSHTCSFSKMALSTSCMLSFTCKMASYSRCSREVLGEEEGEGREGREESTKGEEGEKRGEKGAMQVSHTPW